MQLPATMATQPPKPDDILRSFLARTSIKGVPRAVQSRSLVTRLSWGIATLGCAVMLVYQTATLFVSFYWYGVTVTWVESGAPPSFPDVTVCNQKPYDLFLGFPVSSTQYQNRLTQLQNQVIAKSKEDANVSSDYLNAEFWSRLNAQPGYIVNNPSFSGTYPFSSSNLSFVVDCTWYNWDWVPFPTPAGSGLRCKENVIVSWSPTFYACYTFKAPMQPLMGLTITLYISKFPTSVKRPMNLDISYSIAPGVRVALQNPNTYQTTLQGIDLGPGKEVTIILTEQGNSRLPLPYSPNSPCTTQKSLDPEDPNCQFNYSLIGCLSACRQQQYIDACGCVTSTEVYTARQLRMVNGTFCFSNMMPSAANKNADVLDVLKMAYCQYFMRPSGTTCGCVNPCVEDSMSWSATEANWPAVENQEAFYETYIRPHPEIYGHNFDAYASVLAQKGSITASQLMSNISAVGLIGNNFLQLKILFDTQTTLVAQEVPLVASDTLFSNLGGILNLWLGVTVLFAAEVVELLCQLVRTYCCDRRKEGNNDESGGIKKNAELHDPTAMIF